MFDRSSGKGKTQIGMAKFQAPRGFGEISTPAEGGSISPKKLCESNSATFERAAGTNKRRQEDAKKNGGFEETDWFIRNFTSQLLDPHKK